MERKRKQNKTTTEKENQNSRGKKNIQIQGEYMMDENDSYISPKLLEIKRQRRGFWSLQWLSTFHMGNTYRNECSNTRNLNKYGE